MLENGLKPLESFGKVLEFFFFGGGNGRVASYVVKISRFTTADCLQQLVELIKVA